MISHRPVVRVARGIGDLPLLLVVLLALVFSQFIGEESAVSGGIRPPNYGMGVVTTLGTEDSLCQVAN
jgi:hypothetical protein